MLYYIVIFLQIIVFISSFFQKHADVYLLFVNTLIMLVISDYSIYFIEDRLHKNWLEPSIKLFAVLILLIRDFSVLKGYLVVLYFVNIFGLILIASLFVRYYFVRVEAKTINLGEFLKGTVLGAIISTCLKVVFEAIIKRLF